MATKNTPPAGKPAIHSGSPQGTPVPKGLDRLAEANQVIDDLARQHSELAALGEGKFYAEKAQQRVQAFRKGGYPELDEMPQPTDETYRNQPIYRTSDGRSWLLLGMFVPEKGTTDGPIFRRGDFVFYVDFELGDVTFTDVLEWTAVTESELAEMRQKDEKDAAEHAEIAAAQKMAKTIISKAKRYPYAEHPPILTGMREITLDDVDEAMAKTQAKIVVVGSGTLIVHAAHQDELLAAIPKDAPRHTAKQLRSYTHEVYALMHYLEVLGPLAVSWARTGKRPPSDVDAKEPARRLGANNAFVH